MEPKSSLLSVMRKLKSVYNYREGALPNDYFAQDKNKNDFDELDDPYKVVQSAGIFLSKPSDKNVLDDKSESDFAERIRLYCEQYNLDCKQSLVVGEYSLYDREGQIKYNVDSSGEFKYSGHELVGKHYEDMLRLSANQFKTNSMLICPFVREDDPAITDEMQKANLQLSIRVMIEEGIDVNRIQIRTDKWKHLMDEYKPKEELKETEQVKSDVINSTGVNKEAVEVLKTTNEKGAANDGQNSDAETEKTSEVVHADFSKDKDSKAKGEELSVSDKPNDKSFDVEAVKLNLKEILVDALISSDGEMTNLIAQKKRLAEQNLELGFTANAELINISNIRPQEDGNIYTVNIKPENLENGIHITRQNQMKIYWESRNNDIANGSVKGMLVDSLKASGGDYCKFIDSLNDKGIEAVVTENKRNIAASMTKDGEVLYGQIPLSSSLGKILCESHKEFEKAGRLPSIGEGSYDELFKDDDKAKATVQESTKSKSKLKNKP